MRIATVLTTIALTILMLGCLIPVAPAVAAPPTATVSPGYDHALQDSRRAAQQAQPPNTQPNNAPTAAQPTPAPHSRKRKPHG
jgi:hypothetical protein